MRPTEVMRARAGAALIFALLLLVVLDCVVLGTLHLAVLERRTADNAAASLRLRLAAESAVRSAVAAWPPAADTLSSAAPPLITARALTIEGYDRFASIERIGAGLFMVRGEAAERAGTGRAAALLLVSPPPFPAGTDLGLAALSLRGPLQLTGSIEAAAVTDCPVNPTTAVRTPALDLIDLAGGRIAGDVAYLAAGDDYTASVPAALDRLAANPSSALRTRTGDLVLAESGSGAILVDGSLTITAGVTFQGLILVTGDITLAAGSAVRGAVHAGGAAHVHGTLLLDACAVATTARRTRLMVPQPASGRAWLPAF